MLHKTRTSIVSWIQAIGLGILVLLFNFLTFPIQSHAWDVFNNDGNDGYFLAITMDSPNHRLVPTAIYDAHPKGQGSRQFVEWKDIKVNYSQWKYSEKIPTIGSNIDEWLDKVRGMVKKNKKLGQNDKLGWTFPGFSGENNAKHYTASQHDLDRALWVADTLIHDFNRAIDFVYQKLREEDAISENPDDITFANLVIEIGNHGYSAVKGENVNYKKNGVSFRFTKAKSSEVDRTRGVPSSGYVTIEHVESGEKETFIALVPKGYRKWDDKAEFQPMYEQLIPMFRNVVEESGDKDLKELTWKHAALQTVANYASLNITFTNVDNLTTMSKLEQVVSDAALNLLTGFRQFLGLTSSSDLILNGELRGTDQYYKGIMPQRWMDAVAVLHWIAYAIAWMLIIGAIVKLLVQRNVAAVNPSQRVDMIDGIKNLMIVGFALSVFDLAFAGLTHLNFIIVDMLANSGVGTVHFAKPPISSGFLASILIGFIFFFFDVYFNFFYITRALVIAILYALGPLYVASIAFGERYRQIFGNYVRELIGNIYVQSFHAVIVVFFVSVSFLGGSRAIETIVLLFAFIPLTRFFKESVGASSNVTDAINNSVTGAIGRAAYGAIGSMLFSKNKDKKGNNKGGTTDVEGGTDIQTKSGSSFGSKVKKGAKSMIGYTAKAGLGATKATIGAGMVAGGAATGMGGVSAVGGAMIGSGVGDMGKATKGTAKSGVNAVKKGFRKYKANDRHNIDTTEKNGNPVPILTATNPDGSSVQYFNKKDFSEATGINRINNLDGYGLDNEIELETNFIDGQGFVGNKDLQGTEYEKKMGDLINAFKTNNKAHIDYYREKGITGMRIDESTGRVIFTMDKSKVGIGEINPAGENIMIQRMNPSNQRERKYAKGNANPFLSVLNLQ